jgi:RHH-type rel operon transcriptional repressor/antitoxin RelB
VARITIRLDDALHERLLDQSRRSDLSLSSYIRDVLDRYEGLDPAGYHARFDELQATSIQILAILSSSVSRRSPEIYQQGMTDARRLLRERGLLDPEGDPA